MAFGLRDRYDTTRADARPWLYGIATWLIGRHRRDEVRFYRAIARTGVDPAAESLADQVTRRVAAQALRGQLAAALAGLSRADRDVLLLVTDGRRPAVTSRSTAPMTLTAAGGTSMIGRPVI